MKTKQILLSGLFLACMGMTSSCIAYESTTTTSSNDSPKVHTTRIVDNKKQLKDKIIELKKNNWKIYGNSQSISVVLKNHAQKLKSSKDIVELCGTYNNVYELSEARKIVEQQFIHKFVDEMKGIIIRKNIRPKLLLSDVDYNKFEQECCSDYVKASKSLLDESYVLAKSDFIYESGKRRRYDFQIMYTINKMEQERIAEQILNEFVKIIETNRRHR